MAKSWQEETPVFPFQTERPASAVTHRKRRADARFNDLTRSDLLYQAAGE
jgi:hypothetical protein